MASYRAIVATALAMRGLLANACPAEFRGAEFRICGAKDLAAQPIVRGLTIYLHRVAFNMSRRNLPPRVGLDGARYRPPTPLDLHLLVIAWGQSPEQQQELLGWGIRTLQDAPILPAGFLNNFAGGERPVFREDEAVELVGEALTAAELVSVWEVAKANQQPCVSYVARAIYLDSEVQLTEGPPVQTRGFDYARFASP